MTSLLALFGRGGWGVRGIDPPIPSILDLEIQKKATKLKNIAKMR